MSRLFPWYDSIWLSQYVAATTYLGDHCPQRLPGFASALAPLKTRPDFAVQQLHRVLGDDVVARIKELIGSLPPDKLELHEVKGFGRFVVHDQPALNALHASLVDLVSERVGEAVEPSYSFLSLYTKLGRCPVHMDAPSAKWTLDICIDQSEPWPIHLSQIVPWPEEFASPGSDWSNQIRRNRDNVFTAYTLEPGDALIFSGASQWHYRDALSRAGGSSFSTMLFFHFIPKGMRELVNPDNWGRIFDVPKLTDVVDAAQHAPAPARRDAR
jgi:hypothetical protein